MILIADSGSTKTDWRVVEQGESVRQILTKGTNPFFQTEAEIGSEIATALLPQLQGASFEAVYFYGAGCGFPDKIETMHRVLSRHLPVRNGIEVSTDMLAAARGLCKQRPGIACILGTGSNSCFYNGREIVNNVSPLGFILGDEGSGAVLGKLLVGDLLKNQLPDTLRQKFFIQFGLTAAEVIDRVYRQPFPNRFLAGLSPFLIQNIETPALRTLVLSSFRAFFTRNVMQYDYRNYPVHLIGSVAYHYEALLRQTARELNIEIGTILQSPMEGLIDYHQENLTPAELSFTSYE